MLGAWPGSKENDPRIMASFAERWHHAERCRQSKEFAACAERRPDWLPKAPRWKRRKSSRCHCPNPPAQPFSSRGSEQQEGRLDFRGGV